MSSNQTDDNINGSRHDKRPILCAMGCGFFGNEAFGHCCQKCWRQSLKYSINASKNRSEAAALVAQDPHALSYASEELRSDENFVKEAVSKNGSSLKYAAPSLRANKGVVLEAVSNDPQSLKYALGGMNQDHDLWVAAQMWDKEHLRKKSSPNAVKVVLSTRFSLNESSESWVNEFTVNLNKNRFIRDGDFVVYSPNAFAKATCDPEWTRMEWPCRGTYETCKKDQSLKTGPPHDGCCWRYSFRYHLEEAARSKGFMIQVADFDGNSMTHILGKGQEIETVMAKETGTKVFRIYEPYQPGYYQDGGPSKFRIEQIDKLVSHVIAWYDQHCIDMTVCEIKKDFPGLQNFLSRQEDSDSSSSDSG